MDKPNLPLSTSPSHLLLAGRGVCVRAPRITGWRCPFHLPGEANPLAATTAVFTYVFEKLTVLPWALQHSSRVKVLVIQSCPTLCNPMDCSLPGSSVCGILQGNYTRVGCHSLGDLPSPGTEYWSPALREILCCLSHPWALQHSSPTKE